MLCELLDEQLKAGALDGDALNTAMTLHNRLNERKEAKKKGEVNHFLELDKTMLEDFLLAAPDGSHYLNHELQSRHTKTKEPRSSGPFLKKPPGRAPKGTAWSDEKMDWVPVVGSEADKADALANIQRIEREAIAKNAAGSSSATAMEEEIDMTAEEELFVAPAAAMRKPQTKKRSNKEMASSASSREDTRPTTTAAHTSPASSAGNARSPKTQSLGSNAASARPTPASKSSASSKPIDAIKSKLARWRCKGGKEMWMLTEREIEEAEEGEPLPSESMMSRDEMVREYGRDTTAHLVRAWEASSSLKESVCTPGKEKSWLDLTNLASLDLSGGAYCCRMLLLLETAVLGEEMQNEKAWTKGRSGWVSRVTSLGIKGTCFDEECSPGGNLVTQTLLFVKGINATALFDRSFVEGFDDWRQEMLQLGKDADAKLKTEEPNAKRRRGSRTDTNAEQPFDGFDTAAWLSLVSRLCDGIERWQREA